MNTTRQFLITSLFLGTMLISGCEDPEPDEIQLYVIDVEQNGGNCIYYLASALNSRAREYEIMEACGSYAVGDRVMMTRPVWGDCQANPDYRSGAYCNDGTTSSATGSGACSGHGGVSSWRCE